MAERIALRGRASIKSLLETEAFARIRTSAFFTVRRAHCATAIDTSKVDDEQQQEQEQERDDQSNNKEKEKEKKKNKKGKWLTLPPFSPTIDASLLGKELARVRPSNLKGEVSTSTTVSSTTALKWVLRCCPQVPRCLVQKLFRLRQVRIESINPTSASDLGTEAQEHRLRRVSAKDAMNSGDRILLPFSVQDAPSEKQELDHKQKHEMHYNKNEQAYMLSLELYKDPSIIVVNKPHGMPVQGGIGIRKSLDVLAASYLRYDYSEPPRLVHRLDRDSSGVLVMGRTQMSATILHSIFREKTFGASTDDANNTKRILQRRYWALVIGTPRRAGGLISAPLGKVVLDNGKSERITIVDEAKNVSAQHAVTEYRVIASPVHGFTWIELSPLTGRKHQLRVHCAEALGTPIVGDYKYGWQAHKQWQPVPWSNNERKLTEKPPKVKTLPFALDVEDGSISEKEPHLHLHCRQMVLPNISQALQHLQSTAHDDLLKVESLDFVASLPPHMQRSWDILNS